MLSADEARECLEGLSRSICTKHISDDKLLQILKDVDDTLIARFGTCDTESNDKVSSAWWEEPEHLALENGGIYYEDIATTLNSLPLRGGDVITYGPFFLMYLMVNSWYGYRIELNDEDDACLHELERIWYHDVKGIYYRDDGEPFCDQSLIDILKGSKKFLRNPRWEAKEEN